MAIVDGRLPESLPQSKQINELFSTGIRNLILGFGLGFITVFLFAMPGDSFYWLLAALPAVLLLASGISRLVKAGMKPEIDYRSIERDSLPGSSSNLKLPPVQTEYIKPVKSNYQTDKIAREPHSVTEPTTRQLQIDDEEKATQQFPKE